MSPSSTPDLDAGRKNHLALTATAVILCLSACKLLVHDRRRDHVSRLPAESAVEYPASLLSGEKYLTYRSEWHRDSPLLSVGVGAVGCRVTTLLDRKSTRLNSRHL